MTETMVLIGGPCDGRRVKIDGRPKVYYVPRLNRIDLSVIPSGDEAETRYMAATYEEYVRVESKVYAHVSVSHMDVIDLLVSGYRPELGK